MTALVVATTMAAAGAVARPGTGIPGSVGVAAAAPVYASSLPAINEVWSVHINDGAGGNVIGPSSPELMTLDGGGPSVVVGDYAGYLYAVHLRDGSGVPGWPVSTGGKPIAAAPSTDGNNVFVGAGDPAVNSGGYYAWGHGGNLAWHQSVTELPGGGPLVGVDSGMTVGALNGQMSAFSGSLGQYFGAWNSTLGNALPGFPWFEADSNFSTPAVTDLYHTGQNEIVVGGDSTYGGAYGIQYYNGGHIRVLNQYGGLVCHYDTTMTVQSSPAVGPFLPGGQMGIVSGTGYYPAYAGGPSDNTVFAVDSSCGLEWGTRLDGTTASSPALVNALGNGLLEVAAATNINGSSLASSIYLLNAQNGQVIWRTPALGGIGPGGVTSVDLGAGYQDIVAATSGGVEILDGKTGQVLWTGYKVGDPSFYSFQGAPLISNDANGTVGITVTGIGGGGSQIIHLEVAASGSRVNEWGSWPSFHHDAALSGSAGNSLPVQTVSQPCSPPAGGPNGYVMSTADGNVFDYGNVPFCGSTGGLGLARPIVGMTSTANGGGYWQVASDGGIFTFGNAGFFGSEGGHLLNAPIVGMARTPTGRGYWEVASDGGIFTFGDATFHGSKGNQYLAAPIVGMASTPTGRGYWLVASDGGIFTFGDATWHGSKGGQYIASPVVGMAATPTGNGYWLVGADGGIYTFGDAAFHGSAGGVPLTRPVTGMYPTPSGAGYWLVGADGGIFNYGDASYQGSAGGSNTVAPVVAIGN